MCTCHVYDIHIQGGHQWRGCPTSSPVPHLDLSPPWLGQPLPVHIRILLAVTEGRPQRERKMWPPLGKDPLEGRKNLLNIKILTELHPRSTCRTALTPLNKEATLVEDAKSVCTEERRRLDSAQRALMKELFQRDIDDTVAEILAEETACDNDGVTRELVKDFDGKWAFS